MGKNIIIFGTDISSSEHVGNKGKDILILGEGPTQGLFIYLFIIIFTVGLQC